MSSKNNVTTGVRLTTDDRQVIATLKELMGFKDATSVIRVAIREALMSRIHLVRAKK